MVQKLALKIKESLPKHMIDNKLTKEFFPLAYKNVYKGNKWKKKNYICMKLYTSSLEEIWENSEKKRKFYYNLTEVERNTLIKWKIHSTDNARILYSKMHQY